ncbi:MAG: amino acid permease [Endomicrobium sp.]|nr:amino acid permease [Endomicrobium sp.]
MEESQEIHLKRKLSSRHIQFISLGGTVGTGLFLGAGSTISVAGPSVILAYLLTGIIVFFIMRQLGEMATNEPVAGSSSYFSNKYWGKFPGFLAGWNYWIEYILSGIAELTAVAAYTQYWFPHIATWKAALFFFLLINAINLTTVKAYGETEFWLASIKIITVCAIILTGGYLLIFDPHLIAGSTIKNLWQAPTIGPNVGNPLFSGFFPHGIVGFMMAFPIIVFAFDGIELIGLSAAEAQDPKRTIPKAVNQVVFRILIFYVGSFLVLLSLCHWSSLSVSESPFVMIFDLIGFKYAAWTLNFIILTAALSVYNSCIFCNSRMLYGLAIQKHAPKIFKKTNKRGVPSAAILVSGVLTSLVVPLNYFLPNWIDAFEVIVAFSVIGIIINWGIMVISHLKFRKYHDYHHKKTIFKSPLYPYANYIAIAFLSSILITMALPQFGMFKQVIALPLYVLVIYICYKVFKPRS